MKRTLLLALLALPAWPSVHAQITVTDADLRPSLTQTTTSRSYDADDPSLFQALTQLRGGPHTFDFTVGTYTALAPTTARPVTCSASLPGCDDARLNSAGYVQTFESADITGTSVQFTDLSSTEYRFRGAAGQGDYDPTTPGEETLKIVSTPPSLYLALPLQMGRSWTSTYDLEFNFNGEVLPNDHYTDTGEVVAYGTLVTPAGQAPALLVRERTILTSTQGDLTFTDTTFNYVFITRGNLGASLFTDAQGVVLGADYSVTTLGTAVEPATTWALDLILDAPAPNPAHSQTRLRFTLDTPAAVTLTVVDLLGREVVRVTDGVYPAGTHEAVLDASRMAPGAYLVRLTAGGVVRTRGLAVTR